MRIFQRTLYSAPLSGREEMGDGRFANGKGQGAQPEITFEGLVSIGKLALSLKNGETIKGKTDGNMFLPLNPSRTRKKVPDKNGVVLVCYFDFTFQKNIRRCRSCLFDSITSGSLFSFNILS